MHLLYTQTASGSALFVFIPTYLFFLRYYHFLFQDLHAWITEGEGNVAEPQRIQIILLEPELQLYADPDPMALAPVLMFGLID
jgi:hypothetical protein